MTSSGRELLRGLGYSVEQAFVSDAGAAVYSIQAPWLRVYVRADDQATLTGYADPKLYADSAKQQAAALLEPTGAASTLPA